MYNQITYICSTYYKYILYVIYNKVYMQIYIYMYLPQALQFWGIFATDY